MSAEVSAPLVASEPRPEAPEAATDVIAPDATPTESTSKANEIAADAQNQPTADANGEQPNGEIATAPAETTTSDDAANVKVVAPESTPSSKKSKDKKRRSSTGIPEHKNKKANPRKKEPELQLDAEPGDLYLATMKGFPKWPSIICDDEMLPETLLQNRPVTARRPDGSYREDFLEGGKNVRDRTYPIMYLGTYEFSWLQNTFLQPLTVEEAKNANTTKMSKALTRAYEEAGEDHDIDHFKTTLSEFQKNREQEIEQAEKKAAEAEAKKSKKSKKKAAEDEDEEMVDAEEEPPKSASKKRKAAESSEGAEQKKMKLNLSKTSKTPTRESTSKAKTPKTKTPKKEQKAKPAEPQMSEAERRDKKRQATLYCRHKLQKAFLTSEVPPKEEEMGQMAKFFDQLEKADDIDAGILRDTKIHKVMKGIVKLTSIPKDEDFHFKDRSAALLETWNKLLGDSSDKPRPSTANGEKKETMEVDVKSDDKKESEEKNGEKEDQKEGEKEEETSESVEKSDLAEEKTDTPNDVAMPDADTADAAGEKDVKVTEADTAQVDGEKIDGADAKSEETTS